MPACSINPFIAAYSRFSADFPALKPFLENPAGSAVNAASYLVGAAPGMLLTVFGQKLSTGALWKIQGVHAEFTRCRIHERNMDCVEIHDFTNTRRDCPQQFPTLQV
jgi:hypothetical protein